MTRTAKKCLRAIIEGRTVARTEAVFLAFGELAGLGYIEVGRHADGYLIWKVTQAAIDIATIVRKV